MLILIHLGIISFNGCQIGSPSSKELLMAQGLGEADGVLGSLPPHPEQLHLNLVCILDVLTILYLKERFCG